MSPMPRDRAAPTAPEAADQARWERASRRRGDVLVLRDPRDDAFARLRACHDLDEVLAIDTPARLVARLFGANASKTLIGPLGDALLRGLARGARTHSQIAVAAAVSELLDAGRLAQILAWDDEGHDLVPSDAPTDLGTDLALVLGRYRDANRRLRILTSLWDETLMRRQRNARADAALEAAQTLAKSAVAGAYRHVVTTAANAASTMPKRAAAAMVFEWQVQELLDAENTMVRFAASGRDVDITTLPWADARVPTQVGADRLRRASADLLIATARIRAANEHLVGQLPKEQARLGEATRRAFNLRRHTYVQEILPGRVDALIRFAAGDRFGDAEFMSAQENGFVFHGSMCSLGLRVPAGHVQSAPARRTTITESSAQVAQLVRLGASLPEKPTGWDALLRKVCEPYYVGASLGIDAPAWVHELHGVPVPGTTLEVRVPRDMAELSRWADYMGNCIRSVFGDDVHEGRRVILGLFEGEELRYNVGVEAGTQRIWEINSRFNSGNVPTEVSSGVESLLARLRNRDAAPTTRRPRVPKAPGRSRSKTFTMTQREELDRIARLLQPIHQRADDQRAEEWLGRADLGHLAVACGASTRIERWTSAATALRRVDAAVVAAAFLRELEAGELADAWPLLMHHPLDPHVSDPTLDARVVTSLQFLRDGDDRAQLAQSAPLLDVPVLDAAWQLGRLQVRLRAATVELALARPLAVRALLRNDRSGAARRALALVFVAAADEDPALAARSGPLAWFDLGDPTIAAAAAGDALLLDPTRTAQLLARLGVAIDDAAGLSSMSMRRAELGLAPARCPRAWFTRVARANG